ncbi:hypothetical protein EMIT0158MI4_170155 [Burkholderia ambifaria]
MLLRAAARAVRAWPRECAAAIVARVAARGGAGRFDRARRGASAAGPPVRAGGRRRVHVGIPGRGAFQQLCRHGTRRRTVRRARDRARGRVRRGDRPDREPDVRAGVRALRRNAARRRGAHAPDPVESARRRLRARDRDAGRRRRVSGRRRTGRARARRRVDAARPAVRGCGTEIRCGARMDAANVYRIGIQIPRDAARHARGRPPVRARRCRADHRAAVPGAADVVLVVHHGAPARRRRAADGRHHSVPDDRRRARDAGRADGARVGAGVSLTARHRRAQRNRNRRRTGLNPPAARNRRPVARGLRAADAPPVLLAALPKTAYGE